MSDPQALLGMVSELDAMVADMIRTARGGVGPSLMSRQTELNDIRSRLTDPGAGEDELEQMHARLADIRQQLLLLRFPG